MINFVAIADVNIQYGDLVEVYGVYDDDGEFIEARARLATPRSKVSGVALHNASAGEEVTLMGNGAWQIP
jgi:hypothetical protein